MRVNIPFVPDKEEHCRLWLDGFGEFLGIPMLFVGVSCHSVSVIMQNDDVESLLEDLDLDIIAYINDALQGRGVGYATVKDDTDLLLCYVMRYHAEQFSWRGPTFNI